MQTVKRYIRTRRLNTEGHGDRSHNFIVHSRAYKLELLHSVEDVIREDVLEACDVKLINSNDAEVKLDVVMMRDDRFQLICDTVFKLGMAAGKHTERKPMFKLSPTGDSLSRGADEPGIHISSSGDGLVTVTVNCEQNVEDLTILPPGNP